MSHWVKGKLQIFPKFATVFVNLIQNSYESVILYVLAYDYIIYIFLLFHLTKKKKKILGGLSWKIRNKRKNIEFYKSIPQSMESSNLINIFRCIIVVLLVISYHHSLLLLTIKHGRPYFMLNPDLKLKKKKKLYINFFYQYNLTMKICLYTLT